MKSEGKLKLNPGEDCWVVEREDGEPYDVSCYMFLALVNDYVILSPFINDIEDINETMEYLARETMEDYSSDLSVFPASNCYANREDAENALDANSADD